MTKRAPSFFADPAFRAWLGERLDIREPRVVDALAPTGGGWSSETWLVTLSAAAESDERGRRVVLRLAPIGPAMFPDYDLGRQVACMQALARHPECPVPAIIGADLEGCVIGRPFYVMEFVEGEVPADDRPTFAEAGFLFTASVEEQRRFHGSFLDVLAALHSLPVGPALARMLERLGRGETALERRVSWLEELYRWGRGPAEQPVLERAFAWIARHLPADNRASLVWGDARPANAVVRDFRVVAMLDWELAALGPPELDLFWFLEMNRMRSNGRPLPGFVAPDEAIADYESRADHSVRDVHFHQVFAALQVAVLMLRHLRVAVERGELDEGHKVMTDNTATRRLAALVDRG